MWISKRTLIEYIQEHSINLGLILYSLGLEGGWVIRSLYGNSEYRFIMGDYIDVDWEFFTKKVIDGGLFRLIRRFEQSFGNNFIIYGIGDKVYICIKAGVEGNSYEMMKKLFIGEYQDEGKFLVSFDMVSYYKYPIESIDGFGNVLDMLGI
jgi:hypothetical protein